MTDRIGTIRQKGTSLIDFLSIFAIILILVAILLSYSPTGSDGVFNPSPSALHGAASCRPTLTNACLLKQVLPGGMNEGYAFVQLADGRAVWVGYSVKGSPVTAGVIDRKMACSGMSSLTPYKKTSAGCTSASITPK